MEMKGTLYINIKKKLYKKKSSHFIIKNYSQIKFSLDKFINVYSRNSYEIEIIKEKIYDISQLISAHKSRIKMN